MKVNIDLPEGLSFPTMAAIPFPQGTIKPDKALVYWQLLENNHPVHCHKEIVAHWPDMSVKWLHVHGIFTGGKQYTFQQPSSPVTLPVPPSIPPDDELNWELEVQEGDGSIWKNTANDRALLQMVPADAYRLDIIDDKGGWIYTTADGTPHEETKFVEVQTPFMRVARYEGWLRSDGGDQSVFRYRTRVTRFALDPRIIISNEIILSGSMRDRKIRHIRFVIAGADNSQNVFYGADGTVHNAVIAQNGNITVHQRRPSKCEVTIPGQQFTFNKSDGSISRGGVALITRNFWQKFPQALYAEQDRLAYYQWYGKDQEYTQEEILAEENLHRMLFLHSGEFLENNIPKSGDPNNPQWADKFYGLMPDDEGAEEEFIIYTDHADMQGKTIHDDIVIYAEPVDLNAAALIWNRNPVACCDAAYIESSAVSDFGAKADDFPELEKFMEQSILSYTDPERFQDYGRFIFGDSHRNILVYFNRPSFHRLWLASYYCAGETYWRMYLRGQNPDVLQLARDNTERYRSIVQTSYNVLSGPGHTPEVKDMNVGGFDYRGLWWHADYGQPEGHGSWNTRNGRVPDPDSLLLSWILDGNRYHRDGYELWYKSAKFGIRPGAENTTNSVREANKSLVYGINSFTYYFQHPHKGLRLTNEEAETIQRNLTEIGKDLIKTWLRSNTNGPLMQPEWIRIYVQFLDSFYTPKPGEEQKDPFIARVLHFAASNYNSNFYQDQKTLDMASLLIDIYQGKYPYYYDYYPQKITLDDIRISDHLAWISKIMDGVYKGTDPHWSNFGIGQGELGDSYLRLQWGAFVKRLRSLQIPGMTTYDYDFHGHYPTSEACRAPHHPFTLKTCYGNEYLLLNTNVQPVDSVPPIVRQPIEFLFKLPPVSMGVRGEADRELWIVSPEKHLQNVANRATTGFHGVANKFVAITSNPEINEGSYPDGRSGYGNKDLAYYTSGTDYSFDSFSAPHHINPNERVYSWEKGINLRSTSGTEPYTAYDTIETPNNETGIYHIFIAGAGIVPGMTAVGMPEAMLLTPDPVSFANPSPDRTFVLDPASRKYRLSDCCLYFMNIEEQEVILQFWASVIQSLTPDSIRKDYGSFVRIIEPAGTHDLKFEGTAYGDPQESDIIKVHLQPQQIVRIKTVLVYPTADIIRVHLNGRVLCSSNKGDLLSFMPYQEDIRNGSYELF